MRNTQNHLVCFPHKTFQNLKGVVLLCLCNWQQRTTHETHTLFTRLRLKIPAYTLYLATLWLRLARWDNMWWIIYWSTCKWNINRSTVYSNRYWWGNSWWVRHTRLNITSCFNEHNVDHSCCCQGHISLKVWLSSFFSLGNAVKLLQVWTRSVAKSK